MHSKMIAELSKTLSRDEMKARIEEKLARGISDTEFEKILRDCLPPESWYQADVLRYLNGLDGAFFWKAAAGPYTRGGIPDVVGVIDGRFVAFEIKRPYVGQASALQLDVIRQIREAGGVAEIICTANDAAVIIAEVIR